MPIRCPPLALFLLLMLCVAPAPLLAEAPATSPTAHSDQRPPSRTTATYTNPLHIRAADPEVIRWRGTYYLYATSLTNLGYAVWTSLDLVHWTQHEQPAYAKDHLSWGRTSYWAPGVIQRGDKFYLYYSCKGPVAPGEISFRIGVAVSDNPLGPFKDVKSPLFDVGKAVIDAEPFIDTDGKAYLYYSLDQSENRMPNGLRHSWLYVIRLSEDMLSTVGEPVLCAKASQPWEGLPNLEDTWNEAPYVIKRPNGTYVMFYSARVFVDPLYAVGYATSRSPLGPWTKSPDNPILKRKGRISGPGHCTLARSPDGRELFILYHTHVDPEGGFQRELNIDRIFITDQPNGGVKIRVDGPTRTPQPMPSNVQETMSSQTASPDRKNSTSPDARIEQSRATSAAPEPALAH
jgi:beta-xylosidase